MSDTPDRIRRRRRSMLIGLIVLLGVVVRLAFLFQPIRYDEATTYLAFVRPGLSTLLKTYDGPNNHVFHSLLMWLTTRIGWYDWALRLPAFAAGAAVPWLTYRAGRLLHGRRPALLGAALAAASVHLIEYSTNARGYSLVTCFTLLQVLLGLRIVRSARHDAFAWFALVTALGLYTVPTMLYPTVATALWMLIVALSSRGTPWRTLLTRGPVYAVATIVLASAFYAPILLQTGGWDSLVHNRWVQPIDDLANWRASVLRTGGELVDEWSLGLSRPVLALLALLAIVAFIRSIVRRDARGTWFVVAVVSALGVVFIQRVAPFPRVFCYLLPMFFLAASAGGEPLLRRMKRSIFAAITLATCAGLIGYATVARLPERAARFDKFPEARRVIEYLDRTMTPSDTVALGVVPEGTLRYEWQRARRPMLKYEGGKARVLLVTQTDEPPLLAMRYARMTTAAFGPPVLLIEIDRARVYEARPISGVTPEPLKTREQARKKTR
ncbi:MAG: glycosyltransferase family 39 protein [Tepidisphaeraceae bacterium]